MRSSTMRVGFWLGLLPILCGSRLDAGVRIWMETEHDVLGVREDCMQRPDVAKRQLVLERLERRLLDGIKSKEQLIAKCGDPDPFDIGSLVRPLGAHVLVMPQDVHPNALDGFMERELFFEMENTGGGILVFLSPDGAPYLPSVIFWNVDKDLPKMTDAALCDKRLQWESTRLAAMIEIAGTTESELTPSDEEMRRNRGPMHRLTQFFERRASPSVSSSPRNVSDPGPPCIRGPAGDQDTSQKEPAEPERHDAIEDSSGRTDDATIDEFTESLHRLQSPDWTYSDLASKSDLIVIAKMKSRSDAEWADDIGGDFGKGATNLIANRLQVLSVLKGQSGDEIQVMTLQWKRSVIVLTNHDFADLQAQTLRPNLVTIEIGGQVTGYEGAEPMETYKIEPEYLLYLRRHSDDKYVPVTGQRYSGMSVRTLNN